MLTTNYKMDFSLRINSKEKISVLKKRIAEVLGMDENTFLIKKYGPSANEITDLNALICSITSSDINIFTQLGTPLKDNEVSLNLTFLEYDFSEFKVYPYKFTTLDKLIVHKNKCVKDIKQDLIKLIENKTGKIIENEDYLIMRECIQEKPAKVINF